MEQNPAKTGARKTQILRISIGKKSASKVHFIEAAVPIIPGKMVPPMTRPSGYHDSESYQFQKEYQPSWVKNLVVRKLNHGSNSWITDSYLMTEKILTKKARMQMPAIMLILKTGDIDRPASNISAMGLKSAPSSVVTVVSAFFCTGNSSLVTGLVSRAGSGNSILSCFAGEVEVTAAAFLVAALLFLDYFITN